MNSLERDIQTYRNAHRPANTSVDKGSLDNGYGSTLDSLPGHAPPPRQRTQDKEREREYNREQRVQMKAGR